MRSPVEIYRGAAGQAYLEIPGIHASRCTGAPQCGAPSHPALHQVTEMLRIHIYVLQKDTLSRWLHGTEEDLLDLLTAPSGRIISDPSDAQRPLSIEFESLFVLAVVVSQTRPSQRDIASAHSSHGARRPKTRGYATGHATTSDHGTLPAIHSDCAFCPSPI